MTMRPFGRVVPIQINMLQLVGYDVIRRELRPATGNARNRAMMSGLHSLKRATGADFGYNPYAWRDFLVESGDEFGYTHTYAFRSVDKAVQAAIVDPDVIAALDQMDPGDG